MVIRCSAGRLLDAVAFPHTNKCPVPAALVMYAWSNAPGWMLAPLAAAPPTSAVLWEVLLNALSNWWTLPFRAVSLPSKKKTLPIEASTTGASTMAPVRAWEVDPRHGALPEAHAPVVLNDSRTYQTVPAVPAAFQSPTN